MNFKKTALSIALTSVLGLSAAVSQATVINIDYDGVFTMTSPSGFSVQNGSFPYYYDATWGYGSRTQITGSLAFDTQTGSGSGIVAPFEFFNAGPAVISSISLQAIGAGLLIGNMNFGWNDSDATAQIVLDASGLFDAMSGGIPAGFTVIDQAYCASSSSCAVPASNDVFSQRAQIGAVPIATTSFNVNGATGTTTTLGQLSLGADDGFAGSPMDNGPFSGYNINLDMTSVTISEVPVPAAVWLFGSGLVGLAGVARRRRA